MQTIIVKGSYDFVHKYATAPKAVEYLRQPHRHMFHYEVELEVFHDDRELEFIMVKHSIDELLKTRYEQWPETFSCEQMANFIGFYLLRTYGRHRYACVSIFEDNENGARVYHEKEYYEYEED